MDPTWDYYSSADGPGGAYYQPSASGYCYRQGQWLPRSQANLSEGVNFDTVPVQESPVTNADTESGRVVEVSIVIKLLQMSVCINWSQFSTCRNRILTK